MKNCTQTTETLPVRNSGKGIIGKSGLPPDTPEEKGKKREIALLLQSINRDSRKVTRSGGNLDCMYGWEFIATGTDVISYAVNIPSNRGSIRLKRIKYATAANYQKTSRRSYLWGRMEMYEDIISILAAGVRRTKLSLSKANAEGEWVFYDVQH